MHHEEFEPPEELRDAIKCFWYNRRDLEEQQSSFEVQPDGFAEIIFHFGNGCSTATDTGPLPSPFMVGLLNRPAIFYSKGRLEIMAIRCYPWTVFDLLGLPSGKDSLRVFHHPIAALNPALNKFIVDGKIAEAVVLLKQFLLNAKTGRAGDSILRKAGIALREGKGTIPVSHIAAAANATVRTLERNFKQFSGHTVKDVSGLMRFEQVRNHLSLFPESNIAGLAHELGYTDQSHLNKEFKRYTGITAAAFARKPKQSKL
jgi:AraC-like DNA-binding protein